jgi:ABC-2 type transport system permease protein
MVAATISVVLMIVLGHGMAHPLWVLVFAILGSAFLGGLGIVAAILSEKFDHMAAITNFLVVPLSFLSGTFYSIEGLPPLMQTITHLNPVFYLIDGTRYGFIGVSDSSPWLGLAVCTGATAAVLALAWNWFRTGYRLKA